MTRLTKALVGLIVILLVLLALLLGAVETGWAKNLIRDLIVRQANNYLTATLSIGRLEGSLLRGIVLGDVSVARGDQTLIRVDEIALGYSIRELLQKGVVIRSVRLTRPYVAGAKTADGHWDLSALVKRESREDQRTGPGRPIEIQSIEVIDGHVSLHDPLDFGAAHVPTDFAALNGSLSFAYFPVRWRFTFKRLSWVGHAPDLTVTSLTGAFGRGPGGWFFENFAVQTPRSAFTLDGTADNDLDPTVLDLRVRAPRFAFQEWSGVIRGLKNIAIDASFDTSLKGPLTQIETDLRFTGNGGSVKGRLALDTTVPGWHGAGAVDVERLNLARWLSRPDRPSDITGHVTFDLALELGRSLPRGVYTFDGPHAMYMEYAGDNVRARGQLTSTAVLIARAEAVAYGANVTTTNSSIGINEPFPFRFRGRTTAIDLRRVPTAVPVPHVESLLTFDYDITGQFSDPFITGGATFAQSQFLGATVGAGTVGTIDTSQKPLHYSGDGDVDGVNLHRFGEGLDVAWLQEPRYLGTLSGHFRVDGSGSDRATLALKGGGRLARADLFKGTLSDADVSIEIADGTLSASYDGALAGIDPAVPFADPRLEATLTGSGRVSATVRDLLTRPTTLADYDVQGTLAVRSSVVRDFHVDTAQVEATLSDSHLRFAGIDVAGPALAGHGSGSVALGEGDETDFQYELTRADLTQLRSLTGLELAGEVATKGRLTGPMTMPHASGEGTITQLAVSGSAASVVSGQYDVMAPSGDAARATGRVTGRGSELTLFGQSMQEISGTLTLDAQTLGVDLQIVQTQGRNGRLAGHARLQLDQRKASLEDLTVTLGTAPWHLVARETPPTVSWTDHGFNITPVEFADATNDERIGISGNWSGDGAGAIRVTATHVFLDTLQTAFARPTRLGGVLDLDATISGTRDEPRVAGTVAVSSGRVERVSYQKLEGRFDYAGQMFTITMRLDQAPGVWLTATGTVPLALFNSNLPERPIDVAIQSSTISLGLIEGATDVIRKVSGDLNLDVKAVGTSRDPHMEGTVSIVNAGFLVTASGSTYKNARAAITLARDQMTVESVHVEDAEGRTLDVHGSLGTHELRVGELAIDGTAHGFEVMHNELGRVQIDAALRLTGRLESPRITGDLTISTGSSLRVDEILQRTLFQPYATEAATGTEVDAVAALNPWDRLGLDISLHVPGTLKLVGDNVQVSPGTPIGLGQINLRVAGDLYLYKDPAEPLSVTGSFDSVSGTYAFQGRPFDVDPASSINFRGDLNPEIYVTVTRVISGVEARVSIFGPLREPELRLASTPPLDPSDILSLIVFNTSTNQLSAAQQQQLVVRAGTLAAGFLATPIVTAIENEIGIDLLQVEPGDFGTVTKITVGEELAPGLVARFSRAFGQDAYDEATVEYSLSRILRLRATFSDAQALTGFALFRNVDRAGIDLLLFFSF